MASDIEARIMQELGLAVLVEEQEDAVVVTGLLDDEDMRQPVFDIVAEFAGDRRVEDNLEVGAVLPEEVGDLDLAEVAAGGFDEAATGIVAEESIEPGDFTDQPVAQYPDATAGATSSLGLDETDEGEDEVYTPPTDPVGTDREVIGGLQTSSTDSVEVDRSSDGTLGDEALRDAVLRELREDAATTDLVLDVEVFEGRAILRGTVPFVEDVENAEEVAARVPGVEEVVEELEVQALE